MWVLKPLYYLGWVIQPTSNGYFVYDRADHERGSSTSFSTLEEAYSYVDEQVSRGV